MLQLGKLAEKLPVEHVRWRGHVAVAHADNARRMLAKSVEHPRVVRCADERLVCKRKHRGGAVTQRRDRGPERAPIPLA
jgi:hypothetical protein